MIDYWKLVKEYKVGDMVQRYAPGQGGYSLSPFLGRVTAVHRGLGVLDVQWPYGNERVFPDDIVAVNARATTWFPPSLMDQTYMSLDTERARQVWASASRFWRTTEIPAGFHVDLAHAWAKGASEVRAYDALWKKYGSATEDEVVRDEVQKFYLLSRNMASLRIQLHAAKTAAYWAASNRQYRATSGDLQSKKPACPKCGTSMRKATYKMDKGARVRLFACPKDLFLVRQADLVGPDGEPVEW